MSESTGELQGPRDRFGRFSRPGHELPPRQRDGTGKFVAGGNPTGRRSSARRELADRILDATNDGQDIVDHVLGVLGDPKAGPRLRLEAATWLSDRCFGRPAQTLALGSPDGEGGAEPFVPLSEVAGAAEGLRRRLSGLLGLEQGEGGEVVEGEAEELPAESSAGTLSMVSYRPEPPLPLLELVKAAAAEGMEEVALRARVAELEAETGERLSEADLRLAMANAKWHRDRPALRAASDGGER